MNFRDKSLALPKPSWFAQKTPKKAAFDGVGLVTDDAASAATPTPAGSAAPAPLDARREAEATVQMRWLDAQLDDDDEEKAATPTNVDTLDRASSANSRLRT